MALQWCLSTRDHSKALGDVPGYNRWERLALSYTRDLDMLRVRKRDSLPPPQHHYETKTYQIVQLVYISFLIDIYNLIIYARARARACVCVCVCVCESE